MSVKLGFGAISWVQVGWFLLRLYRCGCVLFGNIFFRSVLLGSVCITLVLLSSIQL
jgi:hypothetical protein